MLLSYLERYLLKYVDCVVKFGFGGCEYIIVNFFSVDIFIKDVVFKWLVKLF